MPCTGPGKLLSVFFGGWGYTLSLGISLHEAITYNEVAFIKMSSNQAIRLFSCSLDQGSK